MKKTYIYGLKDPRDNQIYYVGKSNDPQRRLEQHLEGRINKANEVIESMNTYLNTLSEHET